MRTESASDFRIIQKKGPKVESLLLHVGNNSFIAAILQITRNSP